MTRIRYNVINKETKREETWSGIFDDEETADAWYERYGKNHEAEGHTLKRRVCKDKKQH